MKQFSLDEYMKNPGRRIVTGKGNPARIICTNRKSENCPIIALIQDSTDNYEDAYYYTIDGGLLVEIIQWIFSLLQRRKKNG